MLEKTQAIRLTCGPYQDLLNGKQIWTVLEMPEGATSICLDGPVIVCNRENNSENVRASILRCKYLTDGYVSIQVQVAEPASITGHHRLKVNSVSYADLEIGAMRFQVRRFDRNYKKDDIVSFQNPISTGEVTLRITGVFDMPGLLSVVPGLEEMASECQGFVFLQLADIREQTNASK